MCSSRQGKLSGELEHNGGEVYTDTYHPHYRMSKVELCVSDLG